MNEDYRLCPDCQNSVLWENMIWLNGRCTCPACYLHRKEELDRQKEDLPEDTQE